MLARIAHLAFVLGLVTLPGCEERLPTAPSDLVTGVVVYEHADYAGKSAHITSDIAYLHDDLRGPCLKVVGPNLPPLAPASVEDGWDDCISSIRVAPGWGAILYMDRDFNNDQLHVTEDIPNLTHVPGRCAKGGFNDCVTSIRLNRPGSQP
jgi:hypothetical protein